MRQRVFKSQVQAQQTLPSQPTLQPQFINWLRQTFSWLFSKGQDNARLGQAFVYGDGEIPPWALLGEYDNGTAGGQGSSEYIWLPSEQGGAAIPVGLYRNGRLYAVHSDHLGTPRLITDEANKPVWQWPYSAFGGNPPVGVVATAVANGQTTTKGTKAALEVNLRMPGQYHDEETGTFYNLLRDYDGRSGRYRQPDPIGLAGGVNLFVYANSSPIQYVDPQGLFVDDSGFLAVPAAVAAAATAPAWAAPVMVGAAGGLLANEIARTANQREVHRICDEPPPSNLDPCELAKWKLTKALQCRLVRKNMAEKWFGGTYDRGHATRMSQLDQEIDRLRKVIDKQCKPCP